jgi:glycosyltransferase involved in cell wall biosynthesis
MTRPRIALDLHILTRLMQGSRTYAWNLARRLPDLDPDSDYLFYLPDAHGEEAARLAARNVLPRRVPASRAARLLTFGARLRLDRAALLHCQYLSPPLPPCPCVVTLHDVLHETHPACYPGGMRLLMRRLYPRSARRAALVLTSSEHSRREIVRLYGLPEDRVAAIPLAANEEFRPAPDAAAREAAGAVAARYGVRGKYVLFVGRVEPRKNIPGLVRAFRALAVGGHGDLTLVVAGMVDPLFAARLADDLGQDDPRVALIGRVAPEDLPHLYRGAELFAFPSQAEGFGLPPLEAMACGVPVVCSNTTSLPEVMGDGGILVAPDDTTALVRAMERILTDGELRARLVGQGIAQSSRFSWDRTARTTLAAYHRVLEQARRTR